MKNGEHPLLQGRPEVDEHVPATDQVEVAEGGIPGQVVPCEDAHVADRPADLITPLHPAEEPSQPLRRDVRGNLLRIGAGPRLRESRLAQVGGEDLNGRPASRQPSQAFEQADHERIDLLAGGAPGHPHANGRIGPSIRQEAGEHLIDQDLEGLRVAEERGHSDQAVVKKGMDFVRMAVQVPGVVLQLLDADEGHAARDPPLDGRLLVQAEIDPRGLS